jgi:hypothetical protein
MKLGINDKALNRIVSLQDKVGKKIAEYTKGQKPFAQKPMADDDIIWALRNSSVQDRTTIASEYGVDALNKLLYKAIMVENRRK